MRLYEFEAKRILSSGGLRVPKAFGLLRTPSDTRKLKAKYPAMVKAQALVGGRGKAGGVRKVESAEEAQEAIRALLELRIGSYPVEAVLVEEAVTYGGACYLGITVNPATGNNVIIASAEGGVEIEEVARTRPEALLRVELNENSEALPEPHAKQIAAFLANGLKGGQELASKLEETTARLFKLYQRYDCKLAEVNPLLITDSGPLCADAKIMLDDNGLYRQSELLTRLGIKSKRHDVAEPSAREQRATTSGFPYVDLLPEDAERDPEKIYVGLVPGGAGYGIFSIDEVSNVGNEFFNGRVVPVNFMDSGGGPTRQKVAEMFAMLMDHPLVDVVITSRFGGISSCDTYIRGLVDCLRDRQASGKRIVPVYGRMVGTDLAAARAYLASAKRETPDALEPLTMTVGNRVIMAEIIREGLADFLERGKAEPPPPGAASVLSAGPPPRVQPAEGMLAYLVNQTRPELAQRIAKMGRIETAVVGLGQQGNRHAGLMKQYGTEIAAAVAPGKGGTRAHETIPVYETIREMLAKHPHIAAASIWKHHSSAADAGIEAIEAGIPIVALITEHIPVRDVRRLLASARKHDALLFGPNTPGLIFPPERVKVGMLPDVFQPAEPSPNQYTAEGVTICSRSGAILYHISDALASAGVAQNAVIGVGGDSAVGTPFPAIVPRVSGFPGTHLVVVAGEIGGCAEEMLAEDVKARPEEYPKPIVALISGRCAPVGKTMGHAGAIVAPGSEHGTYKAKRAALEDAGITVVNSQRALIAAVREKLHGKTYFLPERYYERMRQIWEAPPPTPTWGTAVTKVVPNKLAIRGKPLQVLIGKRSLLEVTGLLVEGRFPNKKQRAQLNRVACAAAGQSVPRVKLNKNDDVSKQLASVLLADHSIAGFEGSEAECTAFCLGRTAAALGKILGNKVSASRDFTRLFCSAISGDAGRGAKKAEMLEAAVVASVDHGVTPPSAQATILSASVRASFEVAVASGVSAITDVHGGAGAKAAEFFAECAANAKRDGIPLKASCEHLIATRIADGQRIEGLGHRVHTRDPRRDALWRLAKRTGTSGECVAASRLVEDAFRAVKGTTLPVNVDGVIGAIVADMNLDPRVAKVLFIFGRVAGLAAHYFEEVSTQPPMRRINFENAVYVGKGS